HFFSLFHSVIRVDGEAKGPDPRYTRFPPSEPTLQLLFLLANPSDRPIGDFEPAETGAVQFSAVSPATYNNFQTFTSRRDIRPDGFIFFGHGDIAHRDGVPVKERPIRPDDYGHLVFVRQQGIIFRSTVSDLRAGYTVASELIHCQNLSLGCLLACD